MAEKEIYELGDKPQLGVVPKKMHAFLVRQDRFGAPKDAWQREVINVPSLGPKDVLVYVMATGINYNNVWAALGYPIDVIAIRQKKNNLMHMNNLLFKQLIQSLYSSSEIKSFL